MECATLEEDWGLGVSVVTSMGSGASEDGAFSLLEMLEIFPSAIEMSVSGRVAEEMSSF
jgi:hypothetical protein